MLLKDKKVAIIGGGPVGLTMAVLLQQKGADVTVYERDKDATTRISGSTLDLHKGTGQDALKAAGLLERYYEAALPMGRIVADKHARVLQSLMITPENRYDNPEINRNDLRKLLLDGLKPNTVVWDRKLTTLEVQDGKWLLRFDNDTTATADLVLGANGGMSTVRKYITDATIEYTGSLILQGDVPHAETACKDFYQLCNDNRLMAAGDGTLLVANPKNGDLLSYGVILKMPENWPKETDTDSIITFLLNRLSTWHESYRQLFRSTSNFVTWHTRKISVQEPWKTNRPLPITLIGDAAHIMPPFAGQGVNIGMLDALILSRNLTGNEYQTIEAAISNYEQQMFVYASQAQQETHENEQQMHNPNFSFQQFYQQYS